MRLPSPKLATLQVKQMVLTYNTILFLIGHTLFRVDLHLLRRTYLLLIKVGHLFRMHNYQLVAHQVMSLILWTML